MTTNRHTLEKNRSIRDQTRAQIAESKELCSTSRNLIQRIANLQEFVQENVLTSRTLRPGQEETGGGTVARQSQAKQKGLSSMPVNSSKSSRHAKEAGRKFLFTEVSAGLTFAGIAEHQSEDDAARNRARARAAYDAVVRFADRVSLTQEEREELFAGLNQLKERLQALGERFSSQRR